MLNNSYIFNKKNPLYIGSDHAGFDHKQQIIDYFTNKKISIIDKGTSSSQSCDYPEYAFAVAQAVNTKDEPNFGILICGSANGVAMTANKLKYIRAAVCWNQEITLLARKHNNANIICLPSRFINISICIEYINLFLTSPFEGGRHQARIDKIINY